MAGLTLDMDIKLKQVEVGQFVAVGDGGTLHPATTDMNPLIDPFGDEHLNGIIGMCTAVLDNGEAIVRMFGCVDIRQVEDTTEEIR